MDHRRRPKYRSDALEVLHETMSGLHRHGVIDTATKRRFDLGCLTHEEKQDTGGESAAEPLA